MAGLLKALAPVLETMKCMWFHAAYLQGQVQAGAEIALYGKLEGSRSGNALGAVPGSTRFKMVQPTFEILPDASGTGEDAEFTMLEMGRIVPVYESLGGKTPWGAKLTSRWLRRVMWTVFRDLQESGVGSTGPRGDLQRLFAGVGLGDQEVVEVHAELLGVGRIQRMLGVDEGGGAAGLLHLGHHVQGERGLARAFRPKDLDHPAARQAADAQRQVEAERAGGHRLDLHHLALGAQLHHRALAEGPIDLRQRRF